MLKARTLLYAASPIFNCAEPYLNMDDPSNNNLICYGNYDINRWKLAADAAKAVIDWAPSGGISLITDKGVDKNYKYLSVTADNAEVIFACNCLGSMAWWSFPWCSLSPYNWYPSWGMGYSMTFNFLQKYEKQDGTQQTWNLEGGDDLLQKYNELDRRFMQSVSIVGSYWNNDIQINASQVDGKYNKYCYGGNWITRLIPSSLSYSNYTAVPNDIIFRLAEAYLDYAEALNEISGPVAEAYDAVNIIRGRSGQPDLPSGLTQDQFRERVRNEEAIEFFSEDHRFWDLRRWLIADQDGVMKGDFYGIKAYTNTSTSDYRYEVYRFEVRSFNIRGYLNPFPKTEILKGVLSSKPGMVTFSNFKNL